MKMIVAKIRLNAIEILISKTLIDSCISHNEFVLENNLLRKYDDMIKQIKTPKTSTVHQRFYSVYK